MDEAIALYLTGLSLRRVEAITDFTRDQLRVALKRRGLLRGRLDYHGTPESRLDAGYRVDPETGCWNWIRGTNNMGYGMIKTGIRSKLAHRAMYEVVRGEKVPDHLDLCHQCDNPPCCNPDHLFIGTRAENMQDAGRKGRIPLGEAKPNAKLTHEQVAHIREMAARGMAQRRIAEMVGISFKTINSVVLRKSWRHCP